MLKTYFMLGTDTNCGKTYVTVACIEYGRRQGHTALGLKPIASGCSQEGDALVNEDVQALQTVNPVGSAPICNWMMPDPIAPHLAAKSMGLALSAAKISQFCQSYPIQGLDCLFIEGAGGLMVPLNDTETWIDFLKLSKIPVILVVGMRLGCINHALLSAAVLQMHDIACVGWIANSIDPQMLSQEANLDTLINRLPFPLLGTVSFGGAFMPVEAGCFFTRP